MARTPRTLRTLRTLRTVGPGQEKLGLPTIMDRALAARHGVPYVHMAAFAIDVDRVREAIELAEDYGGASIQPPPFGWEVFLTVAYLLRELDPEGKEGDRAMIEESCVAILEGEQGALGGQLVFAVYVAQARGLWPSSLAPLFSSWKKPPRDLLYAVEPLFADEIEERRALAELCLESELEPPLAPPTRAMLGLLAGP